MNHCNWQSRFDRLDRGGDAGEEWDKLLDDLAGDLVEPYDFDEALRRPFLGRTRSGLRAAHLMERTRLLNAVQPGAKNQQDSPPMKRRKGVMNVIARKNFLIPAAAAAIVVLTSTVWFETRFDSHAAFAQMIENVRQVNSVSFTVTQQVTTQTRARMEYIYVENPPRMRWETTMGQFDFTMTYDGSHTYAAFGPPLRMVRIGKMRMPDHVFQTAQMTLDTLRRYSRDASTEYIGKRDVDGIPCHVYRYLMMEDDPKTSWNDYTKLEIYLSADSLYPVKIIWFGYIAGSTPSEHDEPVVQKTTFNFRWDFDPDPLMFQVACPEGWSVVELPDSATLDDLFPKLDPEMYWQEVPSDGEPDTQPSSGQED